MTPKEKAEELVDKFEKEIPIDIGNSHEDVRSADANVLDISKKCALIAVDEIIFQLGLLPNTDEGIKLTVGLYEVKKEIENL